MTSLVAAEIQMNFEDPETLTFLPRPKGGLVSLCNTNAQISSVFTNSNVDAPDSTHLRMRAFE